MELNATMDEFDARHRHFRETWAVTRFVDGELDLDPKNGFGQHHLGVFVTAGTADTTGPGFAGQVVGAGDSNDVRGDEKEDAVPQQLGDILTDLRRSKRKPLPVRIHRKAERASDLRQQDARPGVQNVETDLLLFVVR